MKFCHQISEDGREGKRRGYVKMLVKMGNELEQNTRKRKKEYTVVLLLSNVP